MEYNSIEIGGNYWTMHGNKPIQVEVIKKKGEKVFKQFRNIEVWNIEKRTTHPRFHWDLFETYEQLRDHVFPKINK